MSHLPTNGPRGFSSTSPRIRRASANAAFAMQFTSEELDAIVVHPQRNGTLTVSETGKVSYGEGANESVES